ncbi:MAG TPA: helix-turn-helix domain-containing protein [Amycolatopsis sp.]|nr:helix-turn-helix domain-containing protein [Amycolatopsis sp.]
MQHEDRTPGGDARSLRMDALEQLRRSVVAAVEAGLSQTQAAREFGVSRKSVGSWVRAYQAGGESSLRPQPRGRRYGDYLALSTEQQANALAVIMAGPPTDHDIPCLLWTRRAVTQVIRQEFGISLAGTTVDNYLCRWDILPKGSFSRWPGSPPGAVRLTWTHPTTPDSADRGHALVAVNHRGALYFLAATEPFTAASLTDFANRLRIQLTRDVRVYTRDWPPEHTEPLADWRSTVPDTLVC